MMELAAAFETVFSGIGLIGFMALWALKAAMGWGFYRFWKTRRKMTVVQK
jgi:hypothetical protein